MAYIYSQAPNRHLWALVGPSVDGRPCQGSAIHNSPGEPRTKEGAKLPVTSSREVPSGSRWKAPVNPGRRGGALFKCQQHFPAAGNAGWLSAYLSTSQLTEIRARLLASVIREHLACLCKIEGCSEPPCLPGPGVLAWTIAGYSEHKHTSSDPGENSGVGVGLGWGSGAGPRQTQLS